MSIDAYLHKSVSAEPGAALLFVFHGTGGDETQFLDVGSRLLPDAGIISPRGDISENGAARFFKRTGEGVYDMDDLALRTQKMAGFARAHVEAAGARPVIGLGYSNGANILASVMFANPMLFDAVVLMHPLIPFEPGIAGDLSGGRVLITAGRKDPICPPDLTARLLSRLESAKADTRIVWHEGGHEVLPSEIEAAHEFLAPYRSNGVKERTE